MAAAKILKSLKQQVTCPRCQCFYTDPVTIKCGHSFCRSCFMKCFDQWYTTAPCPVCKTLCGKRSLRPNFQLKDIVEQVRALSDQPTCEEHPGVNLTLYCEKDETAICVVCSRSDKHRSHSKHIVPLEEAVQKRKRSLMTRSDDLRKQYNKVKDWTSKNQEAMSELEDTFRKEEGSVIEVYENLKAFLEDKKKQTLKIWGADKMKNLQKIQDKLSEAKNQKSALRNLREEINETYQLGGLSLLQDAKSLLSRYGSPLRCDDEEVQMPEIDLDELSQSAQSHSSQCDFLKKKLETFKESFPPEPEPVTLDPDTAHPNLILSDDGKVVKRTDQQQDQPDNPGRFTVSHCVLGKEGFTSGQHYWELELVRDDGWAVGVALDSVRRKEQVKESAKNGIWAFKRRDGTAQTSPLSPLSAHQQRPLKLGVLLNYEGRQVSVYDVECQQKLYTFEHAAFRGKVFPYFWTGEGECAGPSKRQKTMGGFHSQKEVLRVF